VERVSNLLARYDAAMSDRELVICKDSDALAERAAEVAVGAAREAIRQRGTFTLVLSGGSTPEKTYRLLAEPERLTAAEWAKVSIFFGDERCVAADDPSSNFGMARRALLERVPVPLSNVFPMAMGETSPSACADAYGGSLARFFATEPDRFPLPRFDLVLLGLGDDGHTASLFPGKPALDVADRWVTWSPPGILPPPVDRITLTFPVLNAARQVLFLVAGEKKANVLREILEDDPPREKYPAAGIRPVGGRLSWIVDEPAASRLARRR
jgi:6-phosphogluconolactonase